MKNEDLVQSAIIGGLIGAALEALITGQNKNSGLGMLAGAVISASLKANEEALKTDVPVYVKEKNNIYEIRSSGSKRLVKSLPGPQKKLPKRFKLE